MNTELEGACAAMHTAATQMMRRFVGAREIHRAWRGVTMGHSEAFVKCHYDALQAAFNNAIDEAIKKERAA